MPMKKKGRNADLIELRNQALLARYYYWSILCERRFDRVLQTLSKQEFFITENTIMRVLSDQDGYLKKLVDNKVPIEHLAKAFPEFNWRPNSRITESKEQLKLF